MSINIQHNGKLVRFSTHQHTNKEILDILTNSKIEEWNNKSEFSGDYNDLTNRPAALDSITPSKIASWDNKSEFSGDYNDLTNKPDIVDDGSNQLLIVDDNGNIIFKVDEEGVHSINMTVNGMDVATQEFVNEKVADIHSHDNKDVLDSITAEDVLEWDNKSSFSGDYNDLINKPDIVDDGSDQLLIVDDNGNIVFKVDEKGVHSINMTVNGLDVATQDFVNEKVADVHTHNNKDVLDIITSENILSDEQKTQISTAYNHSQAEHAPSDAQKNSDITKEEIEAKLVGEINSHTHAPLSYEEIVNAPDIVEDENGNLNLVDEAGNIIVNIDANGVHTTNIVADDLITSTSASINNISTTSLEIDGVNILTTVDSKINAKFTEIDELLDEITDEEIDAIIASLDE